MISLIDQVEINTTPEQVFAWLKRFPQNYTSWHPEHVACRVVNGAMLEVGSEIECQEYLHGKLHTMRFRMTRIDVDHRIEFEIEGMGRGAFQVDDRGDMVVFTAKLDIGADTAVLGSLFDAIFSRFFQRKIKAMQQHMVEEGQNLKVILESLEPRCCC
jgi:hypothetical protein